MKKFFTQPLLIVTFLSILLPLLSGGCVKKRQDTPSTIPASKEESADEVATRFSYPHAKNWTAAHPEYFLTNPVATGKVSEACSKCHNQLQVAKGLNISCGQNCHKHRESDPKDTGSWKVEIGTAICVTCHKDQAIGKFSHAPAAKGRCLACHKKDEAHIANPKTNKPTLVAGAMLCLKCHLDVDTHSVNHPGTKKGTACASCHNPHGSSQHFLVRENLATNCLNCHSKLKNEFATGNVHPGAEGESACLECHASHGSPYAKILKTPMPVDMAVKYIDSPTTNTYGLCFQCHEKGMLTEKIEASATNFRNDSKSETGEINRYNLHRFHVLEQGDNEGISCVQCHTPHATTQEMGIRTERVNTPTEKTTIIFKKNLKGGECNASCHSDDHYKYQRIDE